MFKFVFAQDYVRGVVGKARERRGHLDVSISTNVLTPLRDSFISCVGCFKGLSWRCLILFS